MLSDNEAIATVPVKPPPTLSRRRTLHASLLGLVEDFQLSGDSPAPSVHSPEYQMMLPYEGAVLQIIALGALVFSVLVETPPDASRRQPA